MVMSSRVLRAEEAESDALTAVIVDECEDRVVCAILSALKSCRTEETTAGSWIYISMVGCLLS